MRLFVKHFSNMKISVDFFSKPSIQHFDFDKYLRSLFFQNSVESNFCGVLLCLSLRLTIAYACRERVDFHLDDESRIVSRACALDLFVSNRNVVPRCKFVEFALVILFTEVFAFAVEQIRKF